MRVARNSTATCAVRVVRGPSTAKSPRFQVLTTHKKISGVSRFGSLSFVGSAAARAGVFVSGEGLKPSAQRFRLVYRQGERRVEQGPFRAPRELAAGFVLLSVESLAAAKDCVDQLAQAFGDCEFFLGPVVEPWEMGMGEAPKDAPLRFLAIYNGDDDQEGSLEASKLAELDTRIEALRARGLVTGSGSLGKTREGARIRYTEGKRTVTDGPFAESKELIAGYAIFDVQDREAALEWATRFGDLGGIEEIDVRPLRCQ